MVVLLIGPQGAGKSTLGSSLHAERGGSFISGGVLVRREIAAGTELGRAIGPTIAAGGRLALEQMYELLQGAVERHETGPLFLDGFPGSADEEGRLVELVGPPDRVLLLTGPATDELMHRLLLRVECPRCYATFNGTEVEHCHKCDIPVAPRPEDGDRPRIVERHSHWNRTEGEIVRLYEAVGVLQRLDARLPKQDLLSAALSALPTLQS